MLTDSTAAHVSPVVRPLFANNWFMLATMPTPATGGAGCGTWTPLTVLSAPNSKILSLGSTSPLITSAVVTSTCGADCVWRLMIFDTFATVIVPVVEQFVSMMPGCVTPWPLAPPSLRPRTWLFDRTSVFPHPETTEPGVQRNQMP